MINMSSSASSLRGCPSRSWRHIEFVISERPLSSNAYGRFRMAAAAAAAARLTMFARAAPPAASTKQDILTSSSMTQYVSENPELCELLGGSQGLQVEQLLDGVINVVFKVHGPSGQSAIVKQALPYVRAVGESFPLSRDRMDVEAAAMQLLQACCPAYIPQLYAYDSQHSILAMQCAPPPHQKLLYCIRQGQVLPGLSQQLAELLSSYLSAVSLQQLPSDQQQTLLEQFANVDIVQANKRVVLLSPFTAGDSSNRWSSPQLDEDVHKMWAHRGVMSSAAAMLALYRSQRECLIHNDLHAGNLLAAPGSLFLIDWEFGTVGPLSFDLGSLMGNIMLAVLSLKAMDMQETQQQQQQWTATATAAAAGGHQLQQQQQQEPPHLEGHNEGKQQPGQHTRREQAEWLLQVMADTSHHFIQLYPQQLASAAAKRGAGSSVAREAASAQQWQQQLLADSCGFAGCCLIRLTIGIHHYPDIQNIKDDNTRVPVERACLQLGQQLLLLRETYTSSSSSSSKQQEANGVTAAADDNDTINMQMLQGLVREACGTWLL